jgi:hypothetical protein
MQCSAHPRRTGNRQSPRKKQTKDQRGDENGDMADTAPACNRRNNLNQRHHTTY